VGRKKSIIHGKEQDMTQHDIPYLNLMRDVLENGVKKEDRTGTGTISVFSRQMRFDLADNSIPLLTTKKMHIPSIIHELLWYVSGNSNIKYLQDNGVRIWNEWADDKGDLGPVYGQQWRKCPDFTRATYDVDSDRIFYPEVIDQLQQVIDTIRTNPYSRRMIVDSWNVALIPQMRLPPCHFCFQFYCEPSGDTNKLHLALHQRSCDVFLGVPFNISQYSILLRMIAQVTGTIPGEFIWDGGDVHIYSNHTEQCNTQLQRLPFDSPILCLNPDIKEIDKFTFDDFEIVQYNHHDPIKAKVAV